MRVVFLLAMIASSSSAFGLSQSCNLLMDQGKALKAEIAPQWSQFKHLYYGEYRRWERRLDNKVKNGAPFQEYIAKEQWTISWHQKRLDRYIPEHEKLVLLRKESKAVAQREFEKGYLKDAKLAKWEHALTWITGSGVDVDDAIKTMEQAIQSDKQIIKDSQAKIFNMNREWELDSNTRTEEIEKLVKESTDTLDVLAPAAMEKISKLSNMMDMDPQHPELDPCSKENEDDLREASKWYNMQGWDMAYEDMKNYLEERQKKK